MLRSSSPCHARNVQLFFGLWSHTRAADGETQRRTNDQVAAGPQPLEPGTCSPASGQALPERPPVGASSRSLPATRLEGISAPNPEGPSRTCRNAQVPMTLVHRNLSREHSRAAICVVVAGLKSVSQLAATGQESFGDACRCRRLHRRWEVHGRDSIGRRDRPAGPASGSLLVAGRQIPHHRSEERGAAHDVVPGVP
jgi:hypothetical protein